jgi:transposase InsO family protein
MQIDLLNRQIWRTKLEMAIARADHIEHFYNSDRRHSSFGHLTPNDFEDLRPTTTQPVTLSQKVVH